MRGTVAFERLSCSTFSSDKRNSYVRIRLNDAVYRKPFSPSAPTDILIQIIRQLCHRANPALEDRARWINMSNSFRQRTPKQGTLQRTAVSRMSLGRQKLRFSWTISWSGLGL